MRCPNCGYELGSGLVPARCPSCGQPVGASRRVRGGAARAEEARESVEGLSGIGAGRTDASDNVKRVVRLLVGLAIVAAFCVIVYAVAWQTELIGGRSIPDVSGWRSDRAVARLESDGFSTSIEEVATEEQADGMVVSTNPGAGTRAEPGTTVTLTVARSEDS